MPTRVAIDVGGTFTDLCSLDERTGRFVYEKDQTTPSNFANGVLTVLRKSRLEGGQIDQFVGTGSTMVINALTERKGARVMLITTKGFRDVLEIQRSNRRDVYNFLYHKPEPLVPRDLRLEVNERIAYDGRVIRELDRKDVSAAVLTAKKQGVAAMAVALYNAYANPAHELECREIIEREAPEIFVTLSHELSGEWREYERTNTAVMNAFVQPAVDLYLTTLEKELKKLGVKISPHVMQSNGGVSTFEQGKKTPIYQVESGPIGGIIGADWLGRAVGCRNIITLDVGGTTAKTSLIDSGKIRIDTEYYLDRNDVSAGYPIKVPVVDIIEIGAGGGSLVWVDEVGAVRVGPQSASADPGPACYGKGGPLPTITDAFLIARVIDPNNFLGGQMKLNGALSLEAFGKVAKTMKKSIEEMAADAIRVATANMVNAIKLVSVRKAYDPRDFVMVAFGGGGPMFASSVSTELGIRKVIVPRIPGVFSAWGMLMTDIRHDFVQTKVVPLRLETLQGLYTILDAMQERGLKQLRDEGLEEKNARFVAAFDIRYRGQEHTVTTPVPLAAPSERTLSGIQREFHLLHHRHYLFTLADPLQVVNVRLTVFGKIRKPKPSRWSPDEQSRTGSKPTTRRAYIGSGRPRPVSVYSRDLLSVGTRIKGPAIVEEPTSTTVILGGQTLEVDAFGNLVIEV